VRARVLAHYPGLDEAEVRPFGAGLINETFLVTRGERRLILQKLAPIFPAVINRNVEAVTRRLAEAGMPTPRLVPTRAGEPGLDLGEDGVWRLQTYVDGVAFDVVASPGQARAAGELVARFHGALDGLPHAFAGLRAGVHDTPRHVARLRDALAAHAGHRLFAQASALAGELLAAAGALAPLPELPARICHGDLKLNNVLFAGREPPASEQALCLIDLDTVGPMALAHELGDAWRSWCNRGHEDAPDAVVDLAVFRASWEGYRGGIGRTLGRDERRALVGGVDWISLELAMRFCTDALEESYFGWDPARYPGRGEHDLARARGQWALHRALEGCRGERARILGLEP
jgi:Ser/Thr protein kinase RdoA (MazF antagonist)